MVLYDKIAKINVEGFQAPFEITLINSENNKAVVHRARTNDWVIKYRDTLIVICDSYKNYRYSEL